MDLDLDLSQDPAALTAALVDIPSVSGDEERLAKMIDAALRRIPHLELFRDGNAMVARTTLGRPERVVLAGHIDTVPIADNLPARLDGDLLYGCGGCDMKSGVAVQLRLAASLPEPNRDVTYVFYDGEEVEAERNGLLRLSRNSPELLDGDLAVLLEPTSAIIEGGCQGTMRAEVRATGERAHSARSWNGTNAIHQAGPILDVLRNYVARQPEVEGLRYHEGLNAVYISGGVAGNVIPDECVVTVNHRFAPDRTVEQAQDYVREIFAGWDVEFTDWAAGARPGLGDPAAAAGINQGSDVGVASRNHTRKRRIDFLKRLQFLKPLHVGLRGLQVRLLCLEVTCGVVRFLLRNRIGLQQSRITVCRDF